MELTDRPCAPGLRNLSSSRKFCIGSNLKRSRSPTKSLSILVDYMDALGPQNGSSSRNLNFNPMDRYKSKLHMKEKNFIHSCSTMFTGSATNVEVVPWMNTRKHSVCNEFTWTISISFCIIWSQCIKFNRNPGIHMFGKTFSWWQLFITA